MTNKRRVAGYVKLAKLWEKRRDAALKYHDEYYHQKYADSVEFELVGVYVDITGNKKIPNRSEMVRLIGDCRNGKVDCIAAQTKGYLAADTGEFCFLFKLLRESRIDLITEDRDYNINTIRNADKQLEELTKMADKYVSLYEEEYWDWKSKIITEIQ